MHPWLVYTEWLQLPTYFTMLMVGFTLASWVVVREARRQGWPVRVAVDACLVAIPTGLVGSRLAHVVLEAPAFYLRDPLAMVAPAGGWVFYGGALGAGIGVLVYARLKGLSFLALGDMLAPAVAFGLVFGRLGCLGGACCRGKPADFPFGWEVPWAVTYYQRRQLPEEILGVPLHPAPLYASLFALFLFVVLTLMRRRQRYAGQVLLAFFALYGAGRFALEVFRADIERGLYLGGLLSTSQAIALVTGGVAVVGLVTSRSWSQSSSTSARSPSTPTESSEPPGS